MIATVRLDSKLETTLSNLSEELDKNKSDIIRDAIVLYAKNFNKNKKRRILNAVKKTKDIDKNEFLDFEDTLYDGIAR